MKKYSLYFYDMILALGMILIIAGFLLFTLSYNIADGIVMVLWPIICMFCGAVFLFFTMVFTHNAYHLFFGLFFSVCGIFCTLVVNDIIPYTMKEWWPSIVIFSAIALFISSYYKKRKMLVAYVFLSVTLALLGFLFLLFSFHVIHVSFKSFVLVFGPFALIVCGIFMIVFFLLQQKYHQFYVEDDADDIDDDVFEQGSNP